MDVAPGDIPWQRWGMVGLCGVQGLLQPQQSHETPMLVSGSCGWTFLVAAEIFSPGGSSSLGQIEAGALCCHIQTPGVAVGWVRGFCSHIYLFILVGNHFHCDWKFSVWVFVRFPFQKEKKKSTGTKHLEFHSECTALKCENDVLRTKPLIPLLLGVKTAILGKQNVPAALQGPKNSPKSSMGSCEEGQEGSGGTSAVGTVQEESKPLIWN